MKKIMKQGLNMKLPVHSCSNQLVRSERQG